MKKWMTLMSLVAVTLVAAWGCQQGPGDATGSGSDATTSDVTDAPPETPADSLAGDTGEAGEKFCAKCGQEKGTEACCKEGAEICEKCNLHKGSPMCCKDAKKEPVEEPATDPAPTDPVEGKTDEGPKLEIPEIPVPNLNDAGIDAPVEGKAAPVEEAKEAPAEEAKEAPAEEAKEAPAEEAKEAPAEEAKEAPAVEEKEVPVVEEK